MNSKLRWILAVFTVGASPVYAESLRDVIDREVSAGLAEQGLESAGIAGDAAFLRRVHLDLVGVIPEYETARTFLDDADPEKREKLVQRLLADERHAQHLANTWDLLLFTRSPANPSATRKREAFRNWLRQQFAMNTRYDEFVRAIMLAEEDDASMFHVQWRNRPEDETEAVSRIFLGTQLHCARCHDHPFEDLTQKDFFGMSGFFVRLMVLQEKKGKDTIYRVGEKSSGEILFAGPATDQTPGQKGEALQPAFLGGGPFDEPTLPEDFEEPDYKKARATLPKPYFSRIGAFADWLTSPENSYFARAAVNRLWADTMGRGLVHPVDNLKPNSKASHPELLDHLTGAFGASGFDLRWFIGELVMSETYQRAAAGETEAATPKYYERARVRPLTAEELIASIRVATGFDVAYGKDADIPSSGEAYMMKIFGKPYDGQGNFQGGLHEHLFFNNAGQLSGIIRAKDGNLADTLLKSEEPWDTRLDRLFLSTLTRLPTDAERGRLASYLAEGGGDEAKRLEEVIWALLNSSQFRFNF